MDAGMDKDGARHKADINILLVLLALTSYIWLSGKKESLTLASTR
jgi:hypothetical protein